ncbi:hypothetical protein WICMUC_004023 [Wickerhamomyces mucosus]|uniref:Respiratory growth induced protein 1 n=1 Tax=Wickerhamomyces mucosus TaxID=1378264 RepID=A0A9P8TC29_9ASCO|nr:hypothetical protein WICMUC_004023 [Wickerhamomyces mucosus]
MAKKDKQLKKKVRALGQLQEFDDLQTFEQFLKDEMEDAEFSNAHAHVNYVPPFVLAASHNDVEKIKDSQNRKNKKFVRHLHQHVEKHLLTEIKESSGMDLKFGKPEVKEDFDTITWKYVDATNHGLGDEGNFRVEVDVKCYSDGAAIDVNYHTIPLVSAVDDDVN